MIRRVTIPGSTPIDPHHVYAVHRWAAGGFGAGLVAFGTAGLVVPAMAGAGTGVVIAGVFTNPVLSALSILVGAVLVAAALRGGGTASTALVVTGPLFLVSGLGNASLIDTPLNMIGFQAGDVVFSLLMGALLGLAGSYGRFSGALPPDSPYARPRPSTVPHHASPDDVEDLRRLAAAERAVATGVATRGQTDGVRAAGCFRGRHERLAAFAAACPPVVPSGADGEDDSAPGAARHVARAGFDPGGSGRNPDVWRTYSS